MAMFRSLFRLLAIATLGLSTQANATLTYNSWTSNEGDSGNYILTIDHIGSSFIYNLTVNPWNAEALGIFFDLGNVTVANSGFSNLNSSAPVQLYATDTSSNTCGSGCNLNGLSLPARAGGDWELVFRLGGTGFDSLQTFSWQTSDFGLNESAFGLVAIRAQQLCEDGHLLDNGDEHCGGSDKAYGYATPTQPPTSTVPEPGALALASLALLGLAGLRRKN